MATITPVSSTASSAAVPFVAASAGGDTIVNADTNVRILVRNGGGGSVTVTLAGAVVCSQGLTHNQVITAAVGDTRIKIPPQCINPDTRQTAVTYSGVTSVTVAAFLV